jgi:hypothetical protein
MLPKVIIGNTPYFIALACSVVILSVVIYYLNKKLAPAPVLNPSYERNETVPLTFDPIIKKRVWGSETWVLSGLDRMYP